MSAGMRGNRMRLQIATTRSVTASSKGSGKLCSAQSAKAASTAGQEGGGGMQRCWRAGVKHASYKLTMASQ